MKSFLFFDNSQIAYGGKLLDFFTGSSSSDSDKTEEPNNADETNNTDETSKTEEPQASEVDALEETSKEQLDENAPEESKEVKS